MGCLGKGEGGSQRRVWDVLRECGKCGSIIWVNASRRRRRRARRNRSARTHRGQFVRTRFPMAAWRRPQLCASEPPPAPTSISAPAAGPRGSNQTIATRSVALVPRTHTESFALPLCTGAVTGVTRNVPPPPVRPTTRADAAPDRASLVSRTSRSSPVEPQTAGMEVPSSAATAASKPPLNPVSTAPENSRRTAAAAGFADPSSRKRPKRYSCSRPCTSDSGIASGAKSSRIQIPGAGSPSRASALKQSLK